MKVRCIKKYCYWFSNNNKHTKVAHKGSTFETENDGLKEYVVDKDGNCIVPLYDKRFDIYFEIIDEETEHNINYSFIKEMLINVADLIDKKNKDYGNSYHLTRENFGFITFLIRLNDKLSRYEQLIQNDRLVEDESLIDTLEDIIGYAALEIEYLSGGK